MKTKLNFKRLMFGIFIGTILTVIFSVNIDPAFDFFLIRWEYILPPIIAIYYLSIQPYLNYADAKTYFLQGAKIGSVLAIIILGINIVYEFGIQGEINIITNFSTTLVSYILFIGSYAMLSGTGHYLFNKNVDPKPKDIFKNKYLSVAMLIGAITFVVTAFITTALDSNSQTEYYEIFIPVIIATYIVIKSHHLRKKDFYNSINLGAITGFLMGLVQLCVLVITILAKIIIYRDDPTFAMELGENLLLAFIVIPLVLLVIHSLIGAALGLGMKFFKNIL